MTMGRGNGSAIAADEQRPRRRRLRRSDPARPGITRRRREGGFEYLTPDGVVLSDESALVRIEALTIPPAWRDVWIAPWDNGHIQAIGTDTAGRRQYLYHARWRERRDEQKFERMLEFARVLPQVRARTARDLRAQGLTRERVLACAVRLLDRGFFRIGGEDYADQHSTYGLATMRREHVTLGENGRLVFEYVGKSGKEHLQAVVDREAYDVVRALTARVAPGEELLAYRDAQGQWRDVRSEDINAYLKELAGEEYSAKDFRTWHATVLMAAALAVSVPASRSAAAAKRAVTRAVQEVATYLGNTPAVCRRAYIDPRVIDRYRDGRTIVGALDEVGGLDVESTEVRERIEAAVVGLIEHRQPPPRRELRRLLLPPERKGPGKGGAGRKGPGANGRRRPGAAAKSRRG
jgi:DNA topoisomerase I